MPLCPYYVVIQQFEIAVFLCNNQITQGASVNKN